MSAAEIISACCKPLSNKRAAGAKDFDDIIRAVGDARVVMLGEATHGTHEFYFQRAEITKRLIQEKQFTTVAVEADWPDAYRANRYVAGLSSDKNAEEALSDFKRFPRWMWRNNVVVDFLEWLRSHNAQKLPDKKIGFYGLDLYSLHRSQEAVIQYLEKVDPDLAKKAIRQYSCFDHSGKDSARYSWSVGTGSQKSCQNEVYQVLQDINRRASEYMKKEDGIPASERLFYAHQNAVVVKNAEEYYRKMMHGRNITWNLRDAHMCDTIEGLMTHFGAETKVIVWEHNSHLGDARATYKARRKQHNVGQLARERFGTANTYNVGFTTYHGSVTAAEEWGDPPQFMRVNHGLHDSYERLFHGVRDNLGNPRDFSLVFRSNDSRVKIDDNLIKALSPPPMRVERAIGVIYRADTERVSHYFEADLPRQFDAVIHIDRTSALEPLEKEPQWVKEEEEEDIPETYPYGE